MFKDRIEAGKALALALKKYTGSEAVIYALPRGGVVTAKEAAPQLGVPLSIIVPRKIGHPFNPEYAIGAVTENELALNESEVLSIDKNWLESAIQKGRAESKRRRELYLGGGKVLSAAGKTAIVIDDGIATGLTVKAAVAEVKKMNPKKIVIAAPVSSPEAALELQNVVDEVIILSTPPDFMAVGQFYDKFSQLTDGEVTELISSGNKQAN